MERLVWDIETNGLLRSASELLCLSIINVDTGEERLYTKGEYHLAVERLNKASLTIGHNLIKFDHPMMKKLGLKIRKDTIFDTLVACRLIYSNVGDIDNRSKRYAIGSMFGSQSLAAWGIRLGGEQKMDYAPVIDPSQSCYDYALHQKVLAGDARAKNAVKKDPMWDHARYTPLMGDYCLQDTRVNVELFKTLEKHMLPFSQSLKLEHDAAWLLAKQERNGFKFDEQKAERLAAKLCARREGLRQELNSKFNGWWLSKGIKTPKRTINYKDPMKASRVEGASFTAVEWVDFNASSRPHIVKVLTDAGWKPREFTPAGQPKVDETVLDGLDFPEAAAFKEWFLLQKRLGQLLEGNQAWLRVAIDGYIHGSVNPNGAVTGRATHSHPNVAQVPACGAEYGAECRELFTVPEGWVLLGSDASGLELRCLAHFMAPFDKGYYIDVVLNGDIHTANQKAAGLATRNEAKRFIYAFLYGAGDELIGQLVGYTQAEYEQWKIKGSHIPVVRSLQRRKIPWTREMVCNILKGREVKKKFLKGLPALKQLIDWCKEQHEQHGHIVGLDGRKVYTRSSHAALNTLLQSAGALVCKQWIVEIDRLAKERGLKHGRDGDYFYCAWVHDEVQVACRNEQIGKLIGELCQEAMRNVQTIFNFECRLDAEADIGSSWKETH